MAESKNGKNQKLQSGFEDDLDSMLNLDEPLEQKVGLIDDDDAIDRLLMGDAFEFDPDEQRETAVPASDVEQMIADEVERDAELAPEYDEFGDDIDDLIADIQLNPKQQKAVEPEDLFAPLPDTRLDDAQLPDVEAVSKSGDLFGVAATDQTTYVDNTPNSDLSESDVLEHMAEIDEFSEPPADNHNDFLMADFDISADDEFAEDVPEAVTQSAKQLASGAIDQDQAEPQVAPATQGELVSGDEENTDEFDNLVVDRAEDAEPEPAKPAPSIDYSAMIAELSAEVAELQKQLKRLGHDLQQKNDKEELASCRESIDSVQSEQKKAKRLLDTLNNKKPVSAYVANGLAVLALIVGSSLGYQGYQAKTQTKQIIDYLGKLQSQVNTAPNADAAEKEMLRNQLDELARANSVTSEQVAELTKIVSGGNGKPAGDVGKQLSVLGQQDMQMGAAIESLQSKVTALEKGKSTVVAKPIAKKPPEIVETWVVNLIAYKQDWYAKRKAEEFAAKGIPAKVAKVETKGEIWYRLTVDGFKSQYEAAAYAARVKKTLNLDSVWINKNKN